MRERADSETEARESMIPNSGNRFSEKIMLKQNTRAEFRFNQKRYGSRSGSMSTAVLRRARYARLLF